jgi:hypothetical protein
MLGRGAVDLGIVPLLPPCGRRIAIELRNAPRIFALGLERG